MSACLYKKIRSYPLTDLRPTPLKKTRFRIKNSVSIQVQSYRQIRGKTCWIIKQKYEKIN